MLSHVIRENPDIKGIKIGDTEIILSQYADDATIFLGEDKNSLKCVMDVLKWFNKMSGLAINKDKSKVIKIGGTWDRRISWEGQFGLKWTHSFEVLGIQYDVFKGRLWFRTKTCLNYLYTTHNHFLIAFPFSHANFGLNSNLCNKPLPAGV